MPTISGTVYDHIGAAASGRIVRVYRRDTGTMLGDAVTSDGLPIAGDTHYANVSLLLHCDGADGSTVFTDNSPTPKTVTVSGTVNLSTAQSQFGGASAYFGGGGHLAVSSSADFDFGTGDFTLELLARPSTLSGTIPIVTRQIDDPSGIALQFRFNGAYPELVLRGISGGTVVILTSSIAASLNTWSHLAVSRQGGLVRIFAGGLLGGSVACGFDMSAASARGLLVGGFDGSNPGAGTRYAGYLDELRTTKGAARYTANFTPPTAPHYDRLPADATPAGSYGIATAYTGEVQRIVLDDDAGALYNDLIDRVIVA